jgi:hypothetical protein
LTNTAITTTLGASGSNPEWENTMAPNEALLDDEFQLVGETTPDERRRVTISKALEALKERFHEEPERIHFMVYFNKAGQILLSPETTIPLREAWLYKNPAAFQSVLRGIAQARAGEVKELGSFAQYANDEDED